MEKTCIICGVTFNSKRSDAEVCSPKCRQKHWRNKASNQYLEKVNSPDLTNHPDWVKLHADKVALEQLNLSLKSEIDELKKQPITQPYSQSPSEVISVGQKIEDWKAKISETTWPGDLQKVMKDLKGSDIPSWGRKQLQSFADQHRINFTN